LMRDRTWILAHPEYVLNENEERIYHEMLRRRLKHEPIAYITGKKEFFGRLFSVTPATLIPRPATELLVEQVMNILKGEQVEHTRGIDEDIVAWSEVRENIPNLRTVLDIGTGSGCIAITLAAELPHLRIIATDIAREALDVAQENARDHHVDDRIEFREERNFESIINEREPFIVVSNPPYIPVSMELEPDVARFEPHAALFGGENGADVVHAITSAARKNPHCAGFAIECRTEQAE
jgi:release factor glutamine methyltransferase